MADLGDRRGIGLGHLERRTDVARPRREQADRVELGQLVRCESRTGDGHRHRRGTPGHLARHAQRHPAGGDDGEVRTRLHEIVHQARCGVDHVLAVVHHEQRPIAAQPASDRRRAPLRGTQPGTDGLEHRQRHRLLVGDRSELDPPHTVGEPVRRVGGDLQREACLPRSPRAHHGDEPPFGDQCSEFGQLVVAAHERREPDRQVVGDGIERTQWREVGGEIRVDELERALGPGEILQPVLADVHQLDRRVELIDREVVAGRGHQHLGAGGDTAEPGRADDGEADVVVVVAQHGFAGVDRHPDPDR